MKALFAIRSFDHFSDTESTIHYLCSQGHQVEALFDREWNKPVSDRVVRAFTKKYNHFSQRWLIRRSDAWRRPLSICRELLSSGSYPHDSGQSECHNESREHRLPLRLRQIFARFPRARCLLTTRLAQYVLRGFERLSPPDAVVLQNLRQSQPDIVVVAVNLLFAEEVEYLKAARALDIPTVVMGDMGDHFSTKGLLHISPDVILVWNRAQQDEVVQIHLLSIEKTLITVFEQTSSAAECVAVIKQLTRGNDGRQLNRQRFVRDFVRPQGLKTPAGELAGKVIEMTARGMSLAEVVRVLDQSVHPSSRGVIQAA